MIRCQSVFTLISLNRHLYVLHGCISPIPKINLMLHEYIVCKIWLTYRETYCCCSVYFQDHKTPLMFWSERETLTPFPQLGLIKHTGHTFVIKHIQRKHKVPNYLSAHCKSVNISYVFFSEDIALLTESKATCLPWESWHVWNSWLFAFELNASSVRCFIYWLYFSLWLLCLEISPKDYNLSNIYSGEPMPLNLRVSWETSEWLFLSFWDYQSTCTRDMNIVPHFKYPSNPFVQFLP